ncbi:MAG: N-acetyltransferase family protein [Verrucomicrobium sp.]
MTTDPIAPFSIRRATAEDAADFLKLVEALAEFEKLDPPDESAQARLVRDGFGPRPKFEAWLGFVAESTEPVAYAIFLETYSSFLALPTVYIEDIFVAESFRKRGIGGALLSKAVGLAVERGCGRVEWTALDWNVNAQKVYEEKLGARRMSEWYLYRMTRREMDAYAAGRAVAEDPSRLTP